MVVAISSPPHCPRTGLRGRFTRSWGASRGGESHGINETIVPALWQSLAPIEAQGPGKPEFLQNQSLEFIWAFEVEED